MVAAEAPRRRFTVDELDQMLSAGIIDEDEPVELLEGELVLMSAQDAPHASLAFGIQELLLATFGPGHHARAHSPLQVGADSLPEPDVAVFRGGFREYMQRHPTGSDALLVVEISGSTRPKDRRKASLYARAGVPEYWLIDLDRRRIEVRSAPTPDGEYSLTRLVEENAEVAVPGSGRTVPVRDLLP